MSESSINLEIKRYWGLILRRKCLALAVALAVTSICTIAAFVTPEVYEATSSVFIQRSTMIDPLMKGIGVSSSMEERLRTLKDSIRSRNIIEQVINKLNLAGEHKDKKQLEGLIDSLQKNILVNVKSGREGGAADLFVISYQGTNPTKVRDIVNTLVNVYIEENVGLSRADASGAFNFIQNQLAEYKTKLEASDRSIRDFREKYPGIIPQTEGAVLTRMETFQTQKIDADIKIQELLHRRDSLNKQLSGEKQLTVAFVTREGSPEGRLSYLNNQLMLLTTKFTAKHPEILKVKAEIEELKQQMAHAKAVPADAGNSETSTLNPVYQQIKEDLGKTDAEIESLRARSSELTRQQLQAKGVLGGMPKEQEEWTKLQRDRTVYQSTYDNLLQKLENARVSKDLEGTDKLTTFKVVDPAVIPYYPVRPDRVKIILVGIFLGLAAGIGSVIGLDQISHSFKDEDAVEEKLKIPVLVSIPSVILENDVIAAKTLDRKLIIAASAYSGLIILVLMREVLHKYLAINLGSF